MKDLKIVEVKSSLCLTNGGVQIYHPKFTNMTKEEAIKAANIKDEYAPYGYNLVIFAKESATLHLFRS